MLNATLDQCIRTLAEHADLRIRAHHWKGKLIGMARFVGPSARSYPRMDSRTVVELERYRYLTRVGQPLPDGEIELKLSQHGERYARRMIGSAAPFVNS